MSGDRMDWPRVVEREMGAPDDMLASLKGERIVSRTKRKISPNRNRHSSLEKERYPLSADAVTEPPTLHLLFIPKCARA